MGNLHFDVYHLRIDLDAGIGKRTTGTHKCTIKSRVRAAVFFLFLTAVIAVTPCSGQDWIKTGTGLGMEKVRLAVPDFKPSTADAQNAALLNVFDGTLWNDLDNAGIFDMVSKSFYPLAVPGTPTDVQFASWSSLPPNAAMLAFGNLGVAGGNVTVQGWLYDVKNIASPQVLGKQYQDSATTNAARTIAHKFADEIIFRLGGGIQGIAESQIYFVSSRTGHKEIWVDGLRWSEPAPDHASEFDFAVSPDFARWFTAGLQFDDEIGLGNPDVLDGPQPAGLLPQVWRHEFVAGVDIGWNQVGLFVISFRRP